MALDIETLTKALKGDVITPEHPGYREAISRWAANSARKAQVVAFVKDNEDVIAALNFAREKGLPIAVKGGGHHVGGASSCETGLVIDLSRYINRVTVDPSQKLAYVGGGSLWKSVDVEAIKYGLATFAGTVNHTGVGGLVLAGGYGWLTAAHGLAIDNLIQATLVTADGSIMIVNEDENEDLYFAIRGGGGNFGVVTEFVLRLYPQRATVYAGLLVYTATSLERIVEATREWWPNVSDDEGMMQATTVAPDGEPIVALVVFFNGPEKEGRTRFKSFLDIGPIADMTKEMPFEEVNSVQNEMLKPGSAVYWKGVANKHLDYPYMRKVHEKMIESIQTGKFKGTVLYEYFPLNKVNAVPRNGTAFRREKVNNVLINISWDPIHDRTDGARDLAHEITGIVIEGQSGMTVSEGLGYTNYDPEAVLQSTGAIDKAQIVFGENYSRLQAIKKRYDPENVFNRWFPIVPA